MSLSDRWRTWRTRRHETRVERAQRRNEANALRLANQRGDNNAGRGLSAGGGG